MESSPVPLPSVPLSRVVGIYCRVTNCAQTEWFIKEQHLSPAVLQYGLGFVCCTRAPPGGLAGRCWLVAWSSAGGCGRGPRSPPRGHLGFLAACWLSSLREERPGPGPVALLPRSTLGQRFSPDARGRGNRPRFSVGKAWKTLWLFSMAHIQACLPLLVRGSHGELP